jgi:hypothetical protein
LWNQHHCHADSGNDVANDGSIRPRNISEEALEPCAVSRRNFS